MRGTLIVFARAPGHGDAKTRLVPALGSELTGRLYAAMLTDTLRNARGSGARVVLAHTPSERFEQQALADALVEQRGETFGERFDHALKDAHELGGGPLVLVGADTPHVSPAMLRAAFARLEAADAVMGPSAEGGFYLVGFRGRPTPVASAFDAANEAAAMARLLGAPGTVALMEPTFDLDVPNDLAELLLHADLARALGVKPCADSTLAALAHARVAVEPTQSGERARRIVVQPPRAAIRMRAAGRSDMSPPD